MRIICTILIDGNSVLKLNVIQNLTKDDLTLEPMESERLHLQLAHREVSHQINKSLQNQQTKYSNIQIFTD